MEFLHNSLQLVFFNILSMRFIANSINLGVYEHERRLAKCLNYRYFFELKLNSREFAKV